MTTDNTQADALVAELRELIEAHDADQQRAMERHGFVGAFACQTFVPLRDWLLEHRKEILAALQPNRPTSTEQDEGEGK